MPNRIDPLGANSDVYQNKPKISNGSIGLDKDAFLKLLLASIKYQDPFSPMDSDKMLQQFTLLTLVEQILEISKDLKDIKNVLQQLSGVTFSANASAAAKIYRSNQGG